MVPIPIHVIRPGKVEVPWVHFEFGGFRIMIVELVFTVGDVVVMDAFDNGSVAEILFNI